MLGRRAAFTTPRSVISLGLGSAESAEPLVRAATDQRLETETNGLGVRLCTRSRLGLSQEPLVDVERLLHTDNNTISIWQNLPTRTGPSLTAQPPCTPTPAPQSEFPAGSSTSGEPAVNQVDTRYLSP